jgi:hypothetical protein
MLAYNILRIIGTEAMKQNDMPVRHKTIKHRRIRNSKDRLILIAGHLTVHARRMKLALGTSNPWQVHLLKSTRSLLQYNLIKSNFFGVRGTYTLTEEKVFKT